MQKPNSHASSASPHPPWPCTACALFALLALALTEDAGAKAIAKALNPDSAYLFVSVQTIAPFVLAMLATLASVLFRARFVRGGMPVWISRGIVYAGSVVYVLAVLRSNQTFYYLRLISRYFEVVFAFETAFQHWQRPPRDDTRGAVLVFLAAILFVMAARTEDEQWIKFLTPPFFVLLVLSMRAARSRSRNKQVRVPSWIGGLLVALAAGGGGALMVAVHKTELKRIVLALMRPAQFEDFADANTRPMLGSSFNQPLSQKRVLKIEGTPVERHMRGMAFEIYSGASVWEPFSEARVREDASVTLKALPGGERLTVTPLIDNLNMLYVPLHMAGVDAKSYKLQWAREWGGPLFAYAQNDVGEPYQIAIAAENHPGPLVRSISDAERKRCLELPADADPAFAQIAAEVQGGLQDPKQKMEAVRRYLWQNHAYSLTIANGPGDKVADFLIHKKDGHCQYFASAAVLLLRCMGLPTRYVTGYYAHESPAAGVLLVRQRDAHAWAEVWLEDEGWVTFDATPPGGMPGQAGGVSRWERFWEKLGDFSESVGAWLRDAPLLKFGMLAGILVVFWIVARWISAWRGERRAERPAIVYHGGGEAFQNLAHAFENYLKRKGAPCPPQRPWVEHLAELAQSERQRAQAPAEHAMQGVPALSIDWRGADEFVREYTAARFGNAAGAECIAKIKALLDKLR